MKRLIMAVLVALFLLPAIADAARYQIVDTKGIVKFYLDGSNITTDKCEYVGNTGIVVSRTSKFSMKPSDPGWLPIIYLMLPEGNDVIFLHTTISDDKGPFRLYTTGNRVWGQLVICP